MKLDYSQHYDEKRCREVITFNASVDELDRYFRKSLERYKKNAVHPGFRKGRVPDNVLLATGYNEIYKHAVLWLVDDVLKGITDSLTPKPIGRFEIDSIDGDYVSGLVIKVSYIPQPQVTLFDINEVRVSVVKPREVLEEDIVGEVKYLYERYIKDKNGVYDPANFNEDLLDSDFYSYNSDGLGDSITSYGELKNFLRGLLEGRYQYEARLQNDEAIRIELLKQSKFEKLEGLVKEEVAQRKTSYINRLINAGVDPEKFLKDRKTSLEQLEQEWMASVEEDLKFRLLLMEYARENGIKASDEEVNGAIRGLDYHTREKYKKMGIDIRNFIYNEIVFRKAYVDIVNKLNLNSNSKDHES